MEVPQRAQGQSPVGGLRVEAETLLLNEHAIFNAPLMKIVKCVYAVLQCVKMYVAFKSYCTHDIFL